MNYFQMLGRVMEGQGRRGDRLLAHITPEEARVLKRRGGAGTRNPVTGLLEFYDSEGDGGSATDSGSPTGDNGDSGYGGGYDAAPADFEVEVVSTPLTEDIDTSALEAAILSGYGPESPGWGSPGMDTSEVEAAILAGYGPESPGWGSPGMDTSEAEAAILAGYGPESPGWGSPGSGGGDGTGDDGGGSDGGGGGGGGGGDDGGQPDGPNYGGDGGGGDSYDPPPQSAEPAQPAAPPRPLVSEAFLDMLRRSQNIGVPQVSAFTNYAPRNVTPAPPLLSGQYVPISSRPPMQPAYFSGLLGGPGAPVGAMTGYPAAPGSLGPAGSSAMPALASVEEYLRRFRGY